MSQDNWVWNKVWSLVGGAGSYALLGFSLVAASLSCASVAVILLLYAARVFTPVQAHLVRPLFFDFTQPEAVATANLLSAEPHTHYVHDLHEFRAKVTPSLHSVPVPATQGPQGAWNDLTRSLPRQLKAACMHGMSLQLRQDGIVCARRDVRSDTGRPAALGRALRGAG